MKHFRFVMVGLVSVALLSSIYISCGGGSSGDSSSSTPTTSTPATISQENLDKTVAFLDDTLPFCSLESTVEETAAKLYSLAALGHDISDQIKIVKLSDRKTIAAEDTEDDDTIQLDGDCGGTLILTLTEDEANGTISGSIDFDNYCNSIEGDTEPSQLKINGQATIAGSTQDLADENQKITLRLNTTEAITITDGADTYTISVSNATLSLTLGDTLSEITFSLSEAVITAGSDRYTIKDVSMGLSLVEVSENEDRITLTISSLVVEEETSESSATYELQDVSLVVTDTGTETTLTVEGTYIDSNEGSVDISTPTAVTINDLGEVTSGVILVDGADGTRVKIEASGGNLFDIQADTDGDGIYDYLPGTMDCSALDTDALF